MRWPIVLVITTLLATTAVGQARAVDVPDGTGLCLRTIDGPKSTLWLAVIDGQGPAQPFWTSQGNCAVLHRLDRDHLLLASYDDPYALLVVDLRAGSHRVLQPGAPHGFVAQHGDDVLYLGECRVQVSDDATSPLPRPGVLRARIDDNFLYAVPWCGDGEPRRLAEVRFARVPIVAGNLAFGITPDERQVWLVSVPGATSRRVAELPEGAQAVRIALSPAGQRLAIGCVAANGKGTLLVVEVGSGKVEHTWSDLCIDVSPLSSSSPTLEVGWHGDTEVATSETRSVNAMQGNFVVVHRDLERGEIVDEAICSALELSHESPTANDPPSSPFHIEHDADETRLGRDGTADPIARIARPQEQFGDVLIAPDGQSAIARLGTSKQLTTLFGPGTAAPRLLCDRWACDFVWLPAVAPTQR